MRIETGHVQFGSDWRGVFIRGDDAFAYIGVLELAIQELKNNEKFSEGYFKSMLTGLADLMKYSNEIIEDVPVQKLKSFAECILETEENIRNRGKNG